LDMKEERIIELQHYIGFCAADKPFVGNQIKSYY
jgi:hypothetical protein